MANKQSSKQDGSPYRTCIVVSSPTMEVDRKQNENNKKEAWQSGSEARVAKFSLPMEPTESIDKTREYPPIVTADGQVDTDIDHLMDNQDEDVNTPLQDIPSRFPKPHLVRIIDGSLDDDIDNLMNHDGTMAHSLVDAPKNFSRSDLKEINSKKSGNKHGLKVVQTDQSFSNMNRKHQEEEIQATSDTEVVPYFERNNSSKPMLSSADPDFCHLKQSVEDGYVSPAVDYESGTIVQNEISPEEFSASDRKSKQLPEIKGQTELNTKDSVNKEEILLSEVSTHTPPESKSDDNKLDCTNAPEKHQETLEDATQLLQQLLSMMSKQELEARIGIEMNAGKPANDGKESEHMSDQTSTSHVTCSDTAYNTNLEYETSKSGKEVESKSQSSISSNKPTYDSVSMLMRTLDNIVRETCTPARNDSQKMLTVAALKMAGDSMTAAAKMADALTLLVRSGQPPAYPVAKPTRNAWDNDPRQPSALNKYPNIDPIQSTAQNQYHTNDPRQNQLPSNDTIQSSAQNQHPNNDLRQSSVQNPHSCNDPRQSFVQNQYHNDTAEDTNEINGTNKPNEELPRPNKSETELTTCAVNEETKTRHKTKSRRHKNDDRCEDIARVENMPDRHEKLVKSEETFPLSMLDENQHKKTQKDKRSKSKTNRKRSSSKKTENKTYCEDVEKEHYKRSSSKSHRREKSEGRKVESDQWKKSCKTNTEENGYCDQYGNWIYYDDCVNERGRHSQKDDKRYKAKRREKLTAPAFVENTHDSGDVEAIDKKVPTDHKEEHCVKVREPHQGNDMPVEMFDTSIAASQDLNASHSSMVYDQEIHHQPDYDAERFIPWDNDKGDESRVPIRYDRVMVRETPTRWTARSGGKVQDERYFDYVVRTLKDYSPTRQVEEKSPEKEYIRVKLVGSSVDPNARDSDFDSIEFNGNARMSESVLVHYDDSNSSQE